MVFVNFPNKDLARSRAFYTAIGATINEEFSDDTAICVVFNDKVMFMILTEEKFKGFSKLDIPDTTKAIETLVAISLPSREAVDEIFEKAIAAGGSKPRETEDLGFMYTRPFCDSDGHCVETFWMDTSSKPE